MDTSPKTVRIESIRIPHCRDGYGSCQTLAESIRDEGLRNPVTLWKDGTILSGSRRLRAHMILGKSTIQGVFVDSAEEAAKRMSLDNEDPFRPMMWTWSEAARFWQLMRQLDAPAAALRRDAARRRGVQLRNLTQQGLREPGRTRQRSEDYILGVICQPFGISAATAHRIEVIYRAAHDDSLPRDRRELARQIMKDVDTSGNVWANFQRLQGKRHAPAPFLKETPVTDSAPADKQIGTWTKGLPQLEGLIASLVELGPPHADLTWEQIGPVRTRLMAVRRELEKIINQMRENGK